MREPGTMSDLPSKDRRARFLVKAGVLESEAESEPECGSGPPAVECAVERLEWGKEVWEPHSHSCQTQEQTLQIGSGTRRSDRRLNSLQLWRGGDGAYRFVCENFSPQYIGSVISHGYSLKRTVSNTLMVLELTLITGGNRSFGIKGKNTVRSQILAKHDGTLCLLWKIVILICQKENWNCLLVLEVYKGI